MNRSGEFIKNLSGEAEYMSFRPSALPPKPELNINDDMLKKLITANIGLARLETASRLIPNAELFVSMYVRKEALLSSQIEGTQCTLDDVLDPNIDANKNLNVEEVVNYVRAATSALERMKTLPLCNRLFKEIHLELMAGVRGQEKNPVEFRRSQNWIGPTNCALKDARYIPPNVEDMEIAMSDLEKYINEGKEYDPLIRIALIHYQFETVHPFLDENGRIGRLMILLYLIEQKLLSKPVIYISCFLKKTRSSIMIESQKSDALEIMNSGSHSSLKRWLQQLKMHYRQLKNFQSCMRKTLSFCQKQRGKKIPFGHCLITLNSIRSLISGKRQIVWLSVTTRCQML